MVAVIGLTGCQSEIGGKHSVAQQYDVNEVEYFAPGPEFKLSKETAAMEAYSDEQSLELKP